MHILFICSKNRWRSLTAETIFKNTPNHEIKSAGTDEGARIKINEKHLMWADKIFVMEKKHKQIISQKFPEIVTQCDITILDIPDEYQYMDEELIMILKAAMEPYIYK